MSPSKNAYAKVNLYRDSLIPYLTDNKKCPIDGQENEQLYFEDQLIGRVLTVYQSDGIVQVRGTASDPLFYCPGEYLDIR